MSAPCMRVGEAGALPEIAAIEQQRASCAGVAAQPVDQRLQMREAAELAEPRGAFLEIETGEGIGIGAIGLDAEAIEESLADQMRRLALHRADAEIDARLAKIHRQQLRMGVGHVQDARVAEAFEIVDALRVGARGQGAAVPRESAAAPEILRKSRRRMVMRYLRASAGRSVNFKRFPGVFLAGRLVDRGLGQRFGFLRRRDRLVEIAAVGGLFRGRRARPRSWSIDCARRRLACWRLRPRHRPP